MDLKMPLRLVISSQMEASAFNLEQSDLASFHFQSLAIHLASIVIIDRGNIMPKASQTQQLSNP